MKDNFSILEKIFYKIIFKANFLNKVLFDMEKVFIKKTHIDYSLFILGLPRSGTTILLNLLSRTNLFACSTYRNMPLVLSPNIWIVITSI